MTNIVPDKPELVSKTNNKLTGLALNGSFLSLLGLKLSSNGQERVNEGCDEHFGGVAKYSARTLRARLAQHLPLPQIQDTPMPMPGP